MNLPHPSPASPALVLREGPFSRLRAPSDGAGAALAGRPYFTSLDGLRALSILGVLWHHVGASNHAWRLLDRGAHGVTLFFVISGFIITTGLLRERERFGSISCSRFFMRRTLRIFP